MPMNIGRAMIMQGWALSEQGHGTEGVAQIRAGMSISDRAGIQLYRPYYLAWLADALDRIGQVDEALFALDEAINVSCRCGVPYWDAELHRRKGELLLATNSADLIAPGCFGQALDIAITTA
jgi:predicted ATPase